MPIRQLVYSIVAGILMGLIVPLLLFAQMAQAGPRSGPPAPSSAPADDGTLLLRERTLIVPVQGVLPQQLSNTWDEPRRGGKHEAIDIMAPRGTPVRAVDDGHVAKLFTSVPGGLTVYQFDPQQQLAYYYAHLDSYAPGMRQGVRLRRGDLIGYVGSTGNASPDAPHLHFAIFRLGPERQWWKGQPINPYPVLRNAGVWTPAGGIGNAGTAGTGNTTR